jgi:hypothetical protein
VNPDPAQEAAAAGRRHGELAQRVTELEDSLGQRLEHAFDAITALRRRPGPDMIAPNTEKLNAAGEVETPAAGVGAWEAPVLAATVEEPAGSLFEPPGVRVEGGGASARLRGSIKVKAASAVLAGGLLLTIPAACRPKKQIGLTFGSTAQSEVLRALLKPNGELTIEAGELKEGVSIRLDDNTWNLT